MPVRYGRPGHLLGRRDLFGFLLVRYGVGGAIVALSDPEEEYEETAVKSAPLLALTGTEFPERRRSDQRQPEQREPEQLRR